MKLPTLKIRSLLAVVAGVALGVLVALNYPVKLSKADVVVLVHDMKYACGDCYVRYRIVSAESKSERGQLIRERDSSNQNDSPVRFIGWDIVVVHNGNADAISDYLSANLETNGECYAPNFRLKGQLKRKLIYSLLYRGDYYDGTYFDADAASAVYRASPGCPKEKLEVPL